MGPRDASKPSPTAAQPTELAKALARVERKLAGAGEPDLDTDVEPDEQTRRTRELRADRATLAASLTVAGLMRTPDCALEIYRDGRTAQPQLDLSHLVRARQILDSVHLAIVSGDADRWQQVQAAWQALHPDEVPAATTEAHPPPVGPAADGPALASLTPPLPALVSRAPVALPSPVVPAMIVPSAMPSALDQTEELTSLVPIQPVASTPDRPDPALPFKPPDDGPLRARQGEPFDPDAPEASTMKLRAHVLPFKKQPVPSDLEPPTTRGEPRHDAEPTKRLELAAARGAPRRQLSEAREEEEVTRVDQEITRLQPQIAPVDETVPLGRTSPLARPRASDVAGVSPIPPAVGSAPAAPAAAPSAAGSALAASPNARGSAPGQQPAPNAPSWLPPPQPRPGVVRSPIQSLEGYASFAAEAELDPGRIAEVRRRFGIADEASQQRLDAYWQGRFAREPGLLEAWETTRQQCRAWLLKRPR